jgi:DNA polymerase zeta
MYYVTRRLIPPLSRIFNLVGADVQAWFDEMPKTQKVEAYASEGRSNPSTPQKALGKPASRNQKIDRVLASATCLVCDATSTEGMLKPTLSD